MILPTFNLRHELFKTLKCIKLVLLLFSMIFHTRLCFFRNLYNLTKYDGIPEFTKCITLTVFVVDKKVRDRFSTCMLLIFVIR